MEMKNPAGEKKHIVSHKTSASPENVYLNIKRKAKNKRL